MSTIPSPRGRKVQPAKRNPLVYFYLAVAAVLVLGAAFLVTFALRGGFGGGTVSAVNAPVGRTAEGFWYKGNPEATVKVVAYEDFQCPACAFYNRNLASIIQRDYIETGKVQFIYHEFPLEMHQHAVVAAEAARCAGDQNKFWEMHDLLFLNQDQWAGVSTPNNLFSGYAGQLSLNRGSFDSCLSQATNQAAVIAAGEAAGAAGASSTPSFSVNGQMVNSSQLPSAIDSALRANGQ